MSRKSINAIMNSISEQNSKIVELFKQNRAYEYEVRSLAAVIGKTKLIRYITDDIEGVLLERGVINEVEYEAIMILKYGSPAGYSLAYDVLDEIIKDESGFVKEGFVVKVWDEETELDVYENLSFQYFNDDEIASLIALAKTSTRLERYMLYSVTIR